ncbi:hypothetical protein SUGI_1184690 [Cryptomeria japonica]|nr:hypothetical protein SUGI_1184690 [Cryptomeria japonica]
MGSDFFWLYLLTPLCPCGEGFVVPLRSGSLAWVFMLHCWHLWVSLVFPIKVVLSSIEGEIDVARVDPSPIEVELDVIRHAWKCCWGTGEVLTCGCKGVDDGLWADIFPLSPIEVGILNGKLVIKVMGAYQKPIVSGCGSLK